MIRRRLLPLLALFLVSGAHAVNSLAEEGRVIVKYRETPDALKQAQALDRTMNLSARLGLALRSGRHISARTQVIRGSGVSSEALAARLSREADVEYAIPDRLRSIRALPNDPLFSGQWYLQTAEAAAIHATAAWDQTTGSPNVVVAVVDTGVRFDHPDLSAKLLPGYDFISDAANAGDGDGRDSDASDPGDFISASDASDPNLQAVCGSGLVTQNSSWHGTRIAGIVGAAGNNSLGIAGASWRANLLPVRVLGKCGGFDSDIMAGMRWAAGLPVPGVPDNPNPARIINLSLGGSGSCTSAYADTIAELAAKGAFVVAAAGNETGPVETPGNCAGVLAVAGIRHVGSKVGYSSFGPEVSVSAPAGNCVNAAGLCLYSIDTTTNLGTTSPAANGYTDANNANVGTSFSAPQAAGVAALMLSLNPALAPADLIARIRQSARAFPADTTLPTCPTVSTSSDSVGQCNCTTTTCGAGMLDAAAAVAAALPPTAAIQALDPLIAGTLIRLDGSSSKAAPGRTLVAWQWSLLSAPAGASLTSFSTPATTLQAVAQGSYTVALTVTDNLGASNATQTTLSVAAPAPNTTPGGSEPPSATSGGGGGSALDGPALLGLAGLAYLSRRRKAQSVPPR
jgi:serine protease